MESPVECKSACMPDSSARKYEIKFVNVTLIRENGECDGPIRTTFPEYGIENIIIPNNKKQSRVVAYRIDEGEIVYLKK